MNYSILLMAIDSTTSVSWSPKVAIVMVVCNILAIAFGKLTMKDYAKGPAMPSPNLFGGFGLPAVLATTSFGHVLGIGAILGLSSIGAL